MSLAGVLRIEGIVRMEGPCLGGVPYILYQSELPELLLDYLHMSFQSGAELWSSQAMRCCPHQVTKNWTPELVFKIYHNT